MLVPLGHGLGLPIVQDVQVPRMVPYVDVSYHGDQPNGTVHKVESHPETARVVDGTVPVLVGARPLPHEARAVDDHSPDDGTGQSAQKGDKQTLKGGD